MLATGHAVNLKQPCASGQSCSQDSFQKFPQMTVSACLTNARCYSCSDLINSPQSQHSSLCPDCNDVRLVLVERREQARKWTQKADYRYIIHPTKKRKLVTFIPCRIDRLSSELQSQSTLGSISTGLRDHLGAGRRSVFLHFPYLPPFFLSFSFCYIH